MSIGKRILYLRKDILKMNQGDFGKPIGIKKGGLSKIETEACNVTEANIIAVCREYNVNEKWLRAGEGEIFNEDTTDIDILMGRYGDTLSSTQRALMIATLKMDAKQKEAIERFLDELESLR